MVPVREVVLRIRHHGEPESDLSAEHPDVTLRSISSLTGRAGTRKRIIEVSGEPGAIPDFLSDFRAADPVTVAEPLSPLGEPRVYVKLAYDAEEWDSISRWLTERGIHYRVGTVISEGWERWTLYLEPGQDLRGIIDALEADGNDVELVRDSPLDAIDASDRLWLGSSLSSLSPRQQEVLVTAIDQGYYRMDRETSIEDIADSVGVAPTTAWEHLTRAEGKVMEDLRDYLIE